MTGYDTEVVSEVRVGRRELSSGDYTPECNLSQQYLLKEFTHRHSSLQLQDMDKAIQCNSICDCNNQMTVSTHCRLAVNVIYIQENIFKTICLLTDTEESQDTLSKICQLKQQYNVVMPSSSGQPWLPTRVKSPSGEGLSTTDIPHTRRVWRESLDPNLRILPVINIQFCPKCIWLWGLGEGLKYIGWSRGRGNCRGPLFVRKPTSMLWRHPSAATWGSPTIVTCLFFSVLPAPK